MAAGHRNKLASCVVASCSILLVICFQNVNGQTDSTVAYEIVTEAAIDASTTAEEEPSRITCYSCETVNGTCKGIENANNTVEQVACPYPDNACMKINTISYTVGESGDYEINANVTARLCAKIGRKSGGCEVLIGASSRTEKCFCKDDLCNKGHVIMTSYVTWLALLSIILYIQLF